MKIKNPRLGKGLSALMDEISHAPQPNVSRETSDGAAEGALHHINIEKIKPGKWQPRRRFKEEELERLASSIRDNGILQPIVVRPSETEVGHYEIIAGERRWRAALRVRQTAIPAIVKNLSDKEAYGVALIENVQRENLSPIEEAEGYEKLIAELKYTQEEVGRVVGKSRTYITNSMRLLTLPAPIRRILQNEEISASHGRALIGIPEAEGLAIVDQIIHKKLNVRQVEQLVKRLNRGGEGASPQPALDKQPSKKKPSYVSRETLIPKDAEKDENAEALAHEIEYLLNIDTDVYVTGPGAGVIQLSFHDLEELDQLMVSLTKLDPNPSDDQ